MTTTEQNLNTHVYSEIAVSQQREADAAEAMAAVLAEIEATTAQAKQEDLAQEPIKPEPVLQTKLDDAPASEQKPDEQPDKSKPTGNDAEMGAVLMKILDRLERLEKPPEPVKQVKEPEKQLSLEQLRQLMRTDPVEAYRQLGVNAADVSRLVLAKQLGDKAPPEIKAAADKTKTSVELAELRERLEAYENRDKQAKQAEQVAAEQKQLVETVQNDVRTYVKGNVSKYERVSLAFKNDPEGTHEDIFNEIARDAAEKARAGQYNARLLTVEEATKLVEANYQKLAKRIGANVENKTVRPPAHPVSTPVVSDRGQDWDSEVDAALKEALAIAKNVPKTK